jgi:hypothetical protein
VAQQLTCNDVSRQPGDFVYSVSVTPFISCPSLGIVVVMATCMVKAVTEHLHYVYDPSHDTPIPDNGDPMNSYWHTVNKIAILTR